MFYNYVIIFFAVSHAKAVQFELGPCLLQYLEPCSDEVIQFYMFSSDRKNSAPLLLDPKNLTIPKWLNLNKSNKLVVHGYGGNIDFYATKAIRNGTVRKVCHTRGRGYVCSLFDTLENILNVSYIFCVDFYVTYFTNGPISLSNYFVKKSFPYETEYLERNNTNIIIVDWGKLSKLPCYPGAVFNTKQAGECVGNFLLKLAPLLGNENDITKIHLVGFSLGAHVVSFASNIVRKSLGVMFERITGLDPALPFFTTADRHSKLDKTDAKFVDVVHTNAGVFGKIEPSGHVDFYMNGGQTQPACEQHKNVPLCSHLLATVYFAESINSKIEFSGYRCSGYFQYFLGFCEPQSRTIPVLMKMGEWCPVESRGVVFIQTNNQPPYAMG